MADENVVLKYCELLDEFIRVRSTEEEDTARLLDGQTITNRTAYQQLVVDMCVVEYREQVLPLFNRQNKIYQDEALVELLYQICIEVNPHLEIHSVTLPTGGVGVDATGDGTTDIETEETPEHDWRSMQRRVRTIDTALAHRVVGQPDAVRSIAQAVKKAAVGLRDPVKPVGVFLMVGPTGTGKTELAKALTRHLFGNLSNLVRVDCSEYALPHEYAKLIGAPPGYIGHNEGGHLTEAVKQNGSCVVLFDEIEKAHEKVHNLLLQLMDEGHLTDSKGERVSFQHCIVLMTSNLGVDDVRRVNDRVGFSSASRGMPDEEVLRDTVREAVKKEFRPEFINRIDEIVQFRSLSMHDCERIAALQLGEMAGYLERTGIHLGFTPSLKRFLAREGWSTEYGARELRRLIRDRVEVPLTDHLINSRFTAGDRVSISVRGKDSVVMTRKKAPRTKKADDSDKRVA